MSTVNHLQVLRRLLGQLRKSASAPKIADSLQVRFIMDEYRRNQVTDFQLCKAEELKYLAYTYMCYLESGRKAAEIHNEYRGNGERSVADTARMVGFKLPHDPK